jgi:hypothetical protein
MMLQSWIVEQIPRRAAPNHTHKVFTVPDLSEQDVRRIRNVLEGLIPTQPVKRMEPGWCPTYFTISLPTGREADLLRMIENIAGVRGVSQYCKPVIATSETRP